MNLYMALSYPIYSSVARPTNELHLQLGATVDQRAHGPINIQLCDFEVILAFVVASRRIEKFSFYRRWKRSASWKSEDHVYVGFDAT